MVVFPFFSFYFSSLDYILLFCFISLLLSRDLRCSDDFFYTSCDGNDVAVVVRSVMLINEISVHFDHITFSRKGRPAVAIGGIIKRMELVTAVEKAAAASSSSSSCPTRRSCNTTARPSWLAVTLAGTFWSFLYYHFFLHRRYFLIHTYLYFYIVIYFTCCLVAYFPSYTLVSRLRTFLTVDL